MYAALLILGWPYRKYNPENLGIHIEDGALVPQATVERFNQVLAAAQKQVLQEFGFTITQESDRTFKTIRPNTRDLEFFELYLDNHFDGEGGYTSEDGIVGVSVSGPYFSHLIDWEDVSGDVTEITELKLQLVARFKEIVAQEFPGFSSASIWSMSMHF